MVKRIDDDTKQEHNNFTATASQGDKQQEVTQDDESHGVGGRRWRQMEDCTMAEDGDRGGEAKQ
jgi:hypothetical protein